MWKKILEDEIKLIKVNKVLTLVDFPKERKTIVNKSILKIKKKANNTIERYKTCLVAKDYTH